MMTRVPHRASRPAAGSERAATYSLSIVERLLHAIGADPRLTEAMFGDLAEEYAFRATWDGTASASWWYGCEVLRSAPHFLRTWIRYASRYERARLAAVLGGLALASLVLMIALPTRNGPPARISTGAADAIVINNEKPVQLPVQVFDAAGHLLKSKGVRFKRIAGAPIPISPSGRVSCRERGDADVRVSLGSLSRDIALRCRPIRELMGWPGDRFVAGDLPTQLRISAIGPDDMPVELIALSAQVQDSDVASLDGPALRPKAPGRTEITFWAGDHWMSRDITVHKRGSSPGTLRVGDGFAAVVKLRGGEVRRWPVPYLRLYDVSITPMTSEQTKPGGKDSGGELTVAFTNANCAKPNFGKWYMCVSLDNSEVVVRAPSGAPRTQEFVGHLTVFRLHN